MADLRAATLAIAVLTTACATPRNAIFDQYPSGIAGHTSVTYYDVHGATLLELRADMRRSGPKISDSSFVAETRSPMKWTWKTKSNGVSSCELEDIQVSVNAQVLLPRWTPPADTEPGLAAEWARFMTALETHENGHKDISAQAGREIVNKLRGLSGSCSNIGSRANDIAHAIVDRAELDQRKYDAETRHGLTQGTSFGRRRVR